MKRLEIKKITDRRNQDKYETKTLADSTISIKNKELEYKKLLEDQKNQFKHFEVQQTERQNTAKRANDSKLNDMHINEEKYKDQVQADINYEDKNR